MNISTNITIFILFFGVALVDAIRGQDWLRAGLFLLLGCVFLYADMKQKD